MELTSYQCIDIYIVYLWCSHALGDFTSELFTYRIASHIERYVTRVVAQNTTSEKYCCSGYSGTPPNCQRKCH